MKKLYKSALITIAGSLLSGTVKAGNVVSQAEDERSGTTVKVTAPNFVGEDNTAIAVKPRILNIGDSRTVGMYFSENAVKYNNTVNTSDLNGNYWFAKVGQGLPWLEQNLDNIQKLAQNSDVVVINLGVNDLAASGNSQTVAEKYIRCLNDLAEDWTAQGKRVFFSSSNPVGPQYRGARVFNQKIDNFNRLMQDGLSENIQFIDTNGFIKGQLTPRDFDRAGLHYTAAVNRKIHQYIELQISNEIAKANGNYNLLSTLQNNGGRNL